MCKNKAQLYSKKIALYKKEIFFKFLIKVFTQSFNNKTRKTLVLKKVFAVLIERQISQFLKPVYKLWDAKLKFLIFE